MLLFSACFNPCNSEHVYPECRLLLVHVRLAWPHLLLYWYILLEELQFHHVTTCNCRTLIDYGLQYFFFFQVGTSLGATRGLLLRGGNVLEKFSMVNSVVFDKTGTLTIGRPAVTKVVPLGGMKITDSQLSCGRSFL